MVPAHLLPAPCARAEGTHPGSHCRQPEGERNDLQEGGQTERRPGGEEEGDGAKERGRNGLG